MTYDEAQGAAAFTAMEILSRLLVKSGAIDATEFEGEMKRYADMHDDKGVGGTRLPTDPQVAELIRLLAKGARLP